MPSTAGFASFGRRTPIPTGRRLTGGRLVYYDLVVGRLAGLDEEAVCRAWEEGRVASATLRAVDGRAFRVAFPGRRRRGAGPDFRDARFYTEAGELIVGDLEVHRQPSDWQVHGHDADPAYASVRFHLVAWVGRSPAPAGEQVVTFRFEAGAEPLPGWGEPCRGAARRLPAAELRAVLRAAGRERLGAKVARSKLWVCLFGREEALYRLLARAFGYGLPEPGLIPPGADMGWAALRAELLAVPEGLRPGRAIALLAERGPGPGRLPIRPANRSDIRLRQPAHLLASGAAGGLWPPLEACFGDPKPLGAVVGLLRSRAPGLGAERARVIAVNGVVPAVAAWAELTGNGPLAERARQAWETAPALGENFITRYLVRRIWKLEGPLPGAEHQGAVDLYHNLCRPGRCGLCPLNAKLRPIL